MHAPHERSIFRSRRLTRGRIAGALSLALALGAADAAHANSLTTAVSQGSRATVPMTVNASGVADPTAILRVYVQAGEVGCASGAGGQENAQAQSVRPGSTEVIAQQPLGPFSYSATYTPRQAGTHYLCAYLFGGSPQTGASQSSASFNVGAAPSPPPGAATSPGATSTAPKRCVVPTLKGRTYQGARKLIRRAGCSVGIVYRPDRRTKRIAIARGRVLRVVSQYPRPRTIRRAKFRLMLRLAYVNPPRRSRR